MSVTILEEGQDTVKVDIDGAVYRINHPDGVPMVFRFGVTWRPYQVDMDERREVMDAFEAWRAGLVDHDGPLSRDDVYGELTR